MTTYTVSIVHDAITTIIKRTSILRKSEGCILEFDVAEDLRRL